MTKTCIQQTILIVKPNNITAHLSETLTYLHRFTSVNSESEVLCA